jgi:hypothetical protein
MFVHVPVVSGVQEVEQKDPASKTSLGPGPVGITAANETVAELTARRARIMAAESILTRSK